MQFLNLRSCLTIISTCYLMSFAACTHTEEPEANDIVNDGKHDFTVDAKTGKINFKTPVVYFEFDSHALTIEGQERLKILADHLEKHPEQRLSIEGHADSRGSHEYNLALGQNRAASVKKFLTAIGVKENRLDTTSFGEEKPAELGMEEKAWSKNRRAEFTVLVSK